MGMKLVGYFSLVLKNISLLGELIFSPCCHEPNLIGIRFDRANSFTNKKILSFSRCGLVEGF